MGASGRGGSDRACARTRAERTLVKLLAHLLDLKLRAAEQRHAMSSAAHGCRSKRGPPPAGWQATAAAAAAHTWSWKRIDIGRATRPPMPALPGPSTRAAERAARLSHQAPHTARRAHTRDALNTHAASVKAGLLSRGGPRRPLSVKVTRRSRSPLFLCSALSFRSSCSPGSLQLTQLSFRASRAARSSSSRPSPAALSAPSQPGATVVHSMCLSRCLPLPHRALDPLLKRNRHLRVPFSVTFCMR